MTRASVPINLPSKKNDESALKLQRDSFSNVRSNFLKFFLPWCPPNVKSLHLHYKLEVPKLRMKLMTPTPKQNATMGRVNDFVTSAVVFIMLRIVKYAIDRPKLLINSK